MTTELLSQMLILLALSVPVIYVCLKLKMPAIVGFLITGVVVGPHGLRFITDMHQIDSLADLGVMLLLFTIGLELSISSLVKIRRTVLLGGGLQVACCTAGVWVAARLMHYNWNTALLFGFLFSLSSTAIVLKLFQERGEMDAMHAQASLAVLIFQDLAVVPMVLVLPLLAGQEGGEAVEMVVAKAAAMVGFIIIMAHSLVPRLLKRMAGTRSRELFLFTIVLICLGTAYLTAKAGLSLALGAFVAGLVISGSPYAQQAISSVLPMRDIFTSLFFVSIGMMMDLGYLAANPFMTLGTALGVMVLNVGCTALGIRLVGQNWRVSLMVGFALCQVGEFAFVLARDGLSYGLLTQDDMALFLNAAVLTMALTPVAMAVGRRVSARMMAKRKEVVSEVGEPIVRRSGHSVIIGFGVVGQAVARACVVAGIPYEIVELNLHTVQSYQSKGEPIIYGDAVNEAVLEHVGIVTAKVMVVSIPDPVATRRIVAAAKSLNPDVYVIARTRFLMEMPTLHKLGADEVVPEEYEAAVAVFSRVMLRFLVPLDVVEAQVAQARSAGYVMFRSLEDSTLAGAGEGDYKSLLNGLDFITLTVQESCPASGRSLVELHLRRDYGLNVVTIKRGPTLISSPGAAETLAPGDLVVALVSDPGRIPAAHGLFRTTAG